MKWKEWNIRLYVNKWVPQWQKSKRRMFLSSGYPVYFSLFDISRFSVKYHTGIITYLKEYSKVKKYVWLIPFWPALTAISARLCNIKYISNFEKKSKGTRTPTRVHQPEDARDIDANCNPHYPTFTFAVEKNKTKRICVLFTFLGSIKKNNETLLTSLATQDTCLHTARVAFT